MRKSFTPVQMLHTGWQAQSETPVAKVCRKMGIREQIFYKLEAVAGIGIAELTTEANNNTRQDETRRLWISFVTYG